MTHLTTPTPTDAGSGRPLVLRMVNPRYEIVTIELLVRCVDADLDEIQYGDRTVGYVQRAGRIFAALIGPRADRAEECGQYLLWDHATARLLSSDRPGEPAA
ncbi:MAG TPA: hypothetical protein VIJ18_06220 [Microbacteriaceae bacterium]